MNGAIFLDTLEPQVCQIGYGRLGLGGNLGYEERQVIVQGQAYVHALSSHPPARLLYYLGGQYDEFHCQVAINGDVPVSATHADFTVRADGRVVASAQRVLAGAAPRPLSAAITGAQTLELLVHTSRWEQCHAVWLQPRLQSTAAASPPTTLADCLKRTEISLPQAPQAERCIATVVSAGWASWLDALFGSLQAHGRCQDALLAVFAVDADDACRAVAANHDAFFIPCQRRASINSTVKSVLYSAARVIDAASFICLDADMLILDDLRPLFHALDVCPAGSVFACREANGRGLQNLDQAIHTVYGGRPADLVRLLGREQGEGRYSLVVNDGIFVAGRAALLALDSVIRNWTAAPSWVDERKDIWWRNQFVFNLALAHLRCGVELDPLYNIQLHSQDVQFQHNNDQIQGIWHGQPVRILHFNGYGRNKYRDWREALAKSKGGRHAHR